MIFRRGKKKQGLEAASGASSPDSLAVFARPVLANYVGERFVDRNRKLLLWIFGVVLTFYGMVLGVLFSITPAPLLAPIAILLLMFIWLLPDMENAPSERMASFMFAYLIALLAWPDYLALQLPGMPWISAIRLVGIPMVGMLLICLSVSPKFRSELKEVMDAVPVLWKAVAIFASISFVSVGFSRDSGVSISKLIIAILYWFSMFFMALHVFRKAGRVERVCFYLWGILMFDCAIALWEGRLQALPWVGHTPSFLQVNDPVVLKILSFQGRAASGLYRVKGKFTTPLGLAEFIGMVTPIVVYFLFNARQLFVRLAALVSLPIIFMTVIGTDSRLAMNSFILSFFVYILVWSFQRWRTRKDSIAGPALLLAYPFMALVLYIASLTVTRIHNAVWGGGAAQASTIARQMQMAKGLPMVFSHPWGHGIGMAATTLNFANPAGEISIDSYFLSVGLEYGVIGFIAFMTMFITALIYCAMGLTKSDDPELQYMAPLSIMIANFLLSKSILSQQDNHSLAFILLGLIGAMYYRYKKERENKALVISSRVNP
ncbi:O-antigen ligase domain-containing protein [Novosphingobium umbonatum]|uniref:O-antigen ligase domain-containing protein n=1 Tax=Novosphingobium umbonatum TaxID=1908524 RepID=A0A437N5H4_9SPHN|nr:O-antigen ligase family protein [Novosphingobium umbonatum]RVU05111.1 O-antigen ligase domain-containing protein [Novosphingobium umbonatum]